MNLEGLSPAKPPIETNLQLERELQERTAELISTKATLQEVVMDRQLVERALSESETKYRSVVNALGEGVVMIGADGKILACNPSAEKILGITAQEFFSSSLEDPRWRVVDEQGNPLPREKWHVVQAFKTGEAFNNILIGMYRADGSLIWLEGNIHPLFRAFEAVPYAVVLSFSDVTERRRLEKGIRQSQKMEAMGRLAGGIAHDFNNILIEIVGYTDLLLGRHKIGSHDHLELLEIKKASDHATSLIRQLLAFSRKQVIQPVALNLNAVLKGMDKLLKRVVGENIELQLRLADGVLPIKADPSQLEQVIMNLTVNACEAMPTRGTLLIRTENIPQEGSSPGLDPQLAKARPYVMLMFKDSGAGVAPDKLNQVFEPFFSAKQRGKGAGLGLATVQSIVSQYQGTIALESALGKGSTFRIYLPVTDDAYPLQRQPASLKGTETVLVVEDDDMLRRLLVKCLEINGYKVLEAPNGDEAIQLIPKNPLIQLLITDLVMLHMTGRELAERLTSLQPDMQVLFMSGYAPDVIAQKGLLKRGAAFIAKPFTTDKLAHQVRELLDLSRATPK